MSKKGKLEEILSKAKYADDPFSYTVCYRDFDKIREVSLPYFLKESNNFETIPITRIVMIMKNDKILFRKSEK